MRTQAVDIRKLPATLRTQASAVMPATRKGLRQAARRSQAIMVEQSADFADTGIFMAAWDVQDLKTGALLLNDAPHAAPLELGRRAAYPPVLPILEYLGRRRGISTAGVGPSREWDLSDQYIFVEREDLEDLRMHAVSVARYLGTHNLPGKQLQQTAAPAFVRITQQEVEKSLRALERGPAGGSR